MMCLYFEVVITGETGAWIFKQRNKYGVGYKLHQTEEQIKINTKTNRGENQVPDRAEAYNYLAIYQNFQELIEVYNNLSIIYD